MFKLKKYKETKKILFKDHALKDLGKLAQKIMSSGDALLVYFEDVEDVFVEVKAILQKSNYSIKVKKFPSYTRPDEEYVKEIEALAKDGSMLLSIGSGSVTDMVRLASYRLKCPHIVIATAPSMDGYLSSNSPVYKDGFKQTFQAKAPDAVVVDLSILENTPNHLLAAGAGDILGKYTANFDWFLSSIVTGEHYDEEISKAVLNSVERCLQGLKMLKKNRKKGVERITESLLISSYGMQLLNTSRCASGGEHMIAHTLEMLLKHKDKSYRLHGENVFIASLHLFPLYKKFLSLSFDNVVKMPDYPKTARKIKEALGLEIEIEEKSEQKIMQALNQFNQYKADLAHYFQYLTKNMKEWEIRIKELYTDGGKWVEDYLSPEELTQSITLAPLVRSKFTLLTLMHDIGVLEEMVKNR